MYLSLKTQENFRGFSGCSAQVQYYQITVTSLPHIEYKVTLIDA